ncbi:MAG: hypothetical protein ABIW79_09775, partial [Gemmatimonas sp.]
MTLESQIFGEVGLTPSGSRSRCLAVALAVLASATVVGAVPRQAEAQRQADTPITTIDSTRANGSVVTVPLRKPTNAFTLFAGEDLACASWRSSGQLTGGTANQGGPAPFNQTGGCASGFRRGGGRGAINFFEMGLIGGAPPSEWRKIRAVYPNARNMLGSPGYTAFWHFTVSTPNRIVIGPADGQFGKRFSGVTIAFDNSCRDDGPAFEREGFSLMAMKDCPPTWGSEGYLGKPVVPDSVWRNRFSASPNTFAWDDFRIPPTQLDPSNLLGTQSFYGYMSDYFREVKLRYGSVVLGGAGSPTEQGYP